MWARFRTSKADAQKYPVLQKSFNVNEEYVHATRTQSYVDFFARAHELLFTEPSSSCHRTMEVLLEPDQRLVPAALGSLPFAKPFSDLLLGFFDASAEASGVCGSLLRSIIETHANYRLVQRALDRFGRYSPEQHDSAVVELGSFTLLSNPFDSPELERFGRVGDRYAAVLRGLNSGRRKVKRRIGLARLARRVASGVGMALHSVFPVPLAKKKKKKKRSRQDQLKKVGERLEVAAKGTYILSRDMDTTGRLAVRLRDEVEHMKETIRYCLERRGDRFPLQEVVKDLRRRGRGFKRRVEELQEHVCLCLVTINRARVLVIKDMDG